MKRYLLTGSLVLAAVSLLNMDAAAQDTIRRSGVLARSPTYSSLLAGIAATVPATEKVTSRTVVASDIRVVDATTVIGSDNEDSVRAALERHRNHLTALRTAVGSNALYGAALASHRDKPTANNVIAVDILADGDVLIYFRKPPQK